jgi:acyl carrier protein
MQTASVYARLAEIFHDVFDDPKIVLNPQLTAADVPDWDSLSHVRLVLTIQRTFGIKFSAAQASGLKNVGELVALIEARVAP